MKKNQSRNKDTIILCICLLIHPSYPLLYLGCMWWFTVTVSLNNKTSSAPETCLTCGDGVMSFQGSNYKPHAPPNSQGYFLLPLVISK